MNYKEYILKRNLSIQLKAFFLLFVFATNTVVGFTCGLGVDMGFNAPHYNKSEEIAKVHTHDNGEKHIHEKKPSTVKAHAHTNGSNHSHKSVSEPPKQHSKDGGSNPLTKEDGGCCANEVQKFQQIDKNITVNTGINLPVFVAILHTYLAIDFSIALKEFPTKYKIRLYYPPPPNLRIAMQRFQI